MVVISLFAACMLVYLHVQDSQSYLTIPNTIETYTGGGGLVRERIPSIQGSNIRKQDNMLFVDHSPESNERLSTQSNNQFPSSQSHKIIETNPTTTATAIQTQNIVKVTSYSDQIVPLSQANGINNSPFLKLSQHLSNQNSIDTSSMGKTETKQQMNLESTNIINQNSGSSLNLDSSSSSRPHQQDNPPHQVTDSKDNNVDVKWCLDAKKKFSVNPGKSWGRYDRNALSFFFLQRGRDSLS